MNRFPGKVVIWLLAVSIAIAGRVSAQEASVPAPFKTEEIEQLVAPIALYPDSLVAQILMASTYPLEVVQAARWSKQNPKTTGKALEDAMQTQTWDPSVKSLTAFPQVLSMLNEKLDMTQRLGDAFLGQQKEVLDAVQRLRAKAQAAGNLKSGKEQTVTTAQEGGSTVIKIEPADPKVVYVPTYDPSSVYGPWPYPAYPPYYWYPAGYYPGYYYPGYVAGAAFFSFTAGVIVGSALWGGCNWGGGNVYVDHRNYNNFNRTNIKDGNWQHRPEHRKGAQYRDRASQQKFGGTQRQGAQTREQFRGRAEQGRRDIARSGDQVRRDVSAADRARTGDRGSFGDRGAGAGDRGGGLDRAGGAGNRGASNFQGAGSGRTAFDGAGRGGGGQTRDFSSRGAASGGATGGGGGFSRGGGGGGGRGGGGGGRGGGGRR